MTSCVVHAEQPHADTELSESVPNMAQCLSHLETTYVRGLDLERYGLVEDRKYLDVPSVERAIAFPRRSSDRINQWAVGTLRAHTQLIDPVLGGVYRYSVGGDWLHPCYTKTLAQQNAGIYLYAAAYRGFGNPEYLSIAERSVDYVESFLKATSGYYFTSRGACVRDASDGSKGVHSEGVRDEGRDTLVKDERISVIENADFVHALAELYAVSTRERFKDLALQGASRLRSIDDGRRHRSIDIRRGSAAYEVLDKAAIGRALFSLYSITGDSMWLNESVALLDELIGNHRTFAKILDGKTSLSSRIEVATALARFSNVIYWSTGDVRYREAAKRALELVSSLRCEEASVVDAARLLLAEEEFRTEPPHAVLIGDGSDEGGEELWQVMLSKLPSYVRRERFRSVLALRRDADMRYPKLARPAAFLCVKRRCSVPIFTAAELAERISEMMAHKRGVGYEDR